MQQALVESRKSGLPLIEVLEGMTGVRLPPDLLRQYKKQQLFELKILYGVESLDPEISQIATSQVGLLIDSLIPGHSWMDENSKELSVDSALRQPRDINVARLAFYADRRSAEHPQSGVRVSINDNRIAVDCGCISRGLREAGSKQAEQ